MMRSCRHQRIVLWLLAMTTAGTASAQTLSIRTPESTAPGATTFIEFLLSSPTAEPLLIAQWDFVFPIQQLQLNSDLPFISEAANHAGKEIHCIGSWKKAPKEYRLRCMVAGGRAPIPAGLLATLRFSVPPVRRLTRIPLAIQNVEVLLEGMRRVKGKDSQTVLVVTP
jgi:hypothetical protein